MDEREEMQTETAEMPVEVEGAEAMTEAAVPAAGDAPAAEEMPTGGNGGPEAETEEAVETAPETESGAPDAWAEAVKRLEGAEERMAAVAAALEERLVAAAGVLGGRMDALQKAVSGMYTQTTDSMHRELEKYRKGLVRKLEQELFGELIELYDAAERGIARAAEEPGKALDALEAIRDQIDAALFNRGVEKREAVPGEAFDGRRHHATGPAVPTGDAALEGTVAATAKAGFDDMDESFKDLRGGCMRLRPVWVRLHKYDPALAAPADPADATDATEAAAEGGDAAPSSGEGA